MKKHPEVLLIGVLLIIVSLYQFIGNTTLYIDEALLINEVMARPLVGLLSPLGHAQVAPIPFLIGMKTLVLSFGTDEWVFRLLPYISYLIFIIVLPSTLRFFGGRVFVAISYFIIGSNWFILYYASMTKQYAVDVMVAQVLLLLMLTMKYRTRPILFALCVGISILMSHIGIILAVACILFLTVSMIQKEIPKRTLGYVIAATIISFGAVYITQINGHPTGPSMYEDWQASFMPMSLNSEFFTFIYSEFSYIWGAYIVSPLASMEPIRAFAFVFGLLFSVLGGVSLIKHRRPDLLALLMLPVVVHLMVSGLEKYPFASRLILYLVPSFAILVFVGVRAVYIQLVTIVGRPVRIMSGAIVALCIVIYSAQMAIIVLPVRNSEVKTALLYILSKKGTTDKIMYDTPAEPIITYYRSYNDRLHAELATVDFVALPVRDEAWYPELDADQYDDQFWVIRSQVVDPLRLAESAAPYIVSGKTFDHCTVLSYSRSLSHASNVHE